MCLCVKRCRCVFFSVKNCSDIILVIGGGEVYRKDGVDVSGRSGVWFTADWHIGHQDILSYCNRPFSSLNHMEESLIERHNQCVGANDVVYDLGDFSCCRDPKKVADILHRLNGKRRYIFWGNHRRALRLAYQRGYLEGLLNSKRIVFVGDYAANIESSMMVKVQDQKLVLCHYPYSTWNGIYEGVWHFHGHAHGRMKRDNTFSLDVGVDVHDYKPISFDQVSFFMEKTKERMKNVGFLIPGEDSFEEVWF